MSRQSLASPRATGVALLLGKPARLRGKAPEARQTLRQGRPGGDVRASSTRGVSAFREGPVTGPASRKRPTSPGFQPDGGEQGVHPPLVREGFGAGSGHGDLKAGAMAVLRRRLRDFTRRTSPGAC